jgi:metal-responsive CopG/Arc/MetJ family transcriptional regulator
MVAVRMPQTLIDDADAWGEANAAGRSEAIRRLVELGLKVRGK